MSSKSSAFGRFLLIALVLMGVFALATGRLEFSFKQSFTGRKLIEAFTKDSAPRSNRTAASPSKPKAKSAAPVNLEAQDNISLADSRKLDSLIAENAD